MKINIVETGFDWMETAETIDSTATGVEEAKTIVAAQGWRVMPDDEGGCCELRYLDDDEDGIEISITVYPRN